MKSSFFLKFNLSIILFLFLSIFVYSEDVGNFSFLHISDSHLSPHQTMPADLSKERSYETIQKLADLKDVLLKPYNVIAPAPDFIIHTGDITEFGFPGEVWSLYSKYFDKFKIPIYLQYGNHDITWVMDSNKLRELYGGINYSFNHKGVHFIGICTGTIQEPLPSISEEAIKFIKKDLSNIDNRKPIILFLHHPLFVNEFCSKYEVDRMLDLFKEYNLILFLDGHGHAPEHHTVQGFDGVEGGSTFKHKNAPDGGCNVIFINNNKLYSAYKRVNDKDAENGLIEKEIPQSNSYPKITILSPIQNELYNKNVTISASLQGNPYPIKRVFCSINDEVEKDLNFSGETASGDLDIKSLYNGYNFIRICFEYEKDKYYQKSLSFIFQNENKKSALLKWNFRFDGSSKSKPIIYKNKILVGSNDGFLYCIDKKSGKLLWKYDSGAEILAQPLIIEPNIFSKTRVIFGTGNGKMICLSLNGKLIWDYKTSAAIYSSAEKDKNDIIYFGNNKGELTALNSKNGRLIWINNDSKLTIETKPVIYNNKIYYGSWDGYLFCIDQKTGKTDWKTPGPKNQQKVITYYAPADNSPVIVDDKIFLTDRGYVCGLYDLKGNYIKEIATGCSAISLSEDKKYIYLRGLQEPLKKINLNGDLIWESKIQAGRFPVSPTSQGNNIYICTNSGQLYCLDADKGEIKSEYQVTPKMYVMSEVAAENGIAYVSTIAGELLAIDMIK